MNHLKAIGLVALALLVVVWSFTAQAQTAPAPALKAEVMVTGDIVRIGDILDHAGDKASQAVFRAPALGATGTIQVHRITAALRAHGILVFDTRNVTEVLVSRISRTVSLQDLGRAVAEAAVKRYDLASAADVAVTFDSHLRPLQVEQDVADAPRITSIVFDANTGRFEAIVDMPGSLSLRRNPVRLTGAMLETAEVVTLARVITRGETIRESDLVIERLPRAEVAADALQRVAQVANQAARRQLRAGQTLRAPDLMKPQIVSRDETVTIIYRTAGITLTARGKALSNGTEGEIVSVLNPQSKRTVQATVTAPGVVTVSDPAPVATAAVPQTR
jgi:flagella basal body P-ring formation protein FlgA